MLRVLGVSFPQVLAAAIGIFLFLHVVELPEEPEYTPEEIQEYRSRMIEIVNATDGCHDSGTYTSHFEDHSLADDVLRNLSEEGLLGTEIEGGGFFESQETVYCPIENLSERTFDGSTEMIR